MATETERKGTLRFITRANARARMSFVGRVKNQIGRRGAMLMSYGIFWILVGVGLLVNPAPANPKPLLFEQIPPTARLVIWLVTGGIAIFLSFGGRRVPDSYGWLSLYLMPAFQFLSYILGWIAYTTGLEFPLIGESPRGWFISIFYASFMVPIIICAGWKENPILLSEGDVRDAQ